MLLFYHHGKDYGKIFLAVLPWALSIFGIHTFLYNKFPKYYFFILKFISKGHDTVWEVNSNFVLSNLEKCYDNIEDVLSKRYFGNYKKNINMKNKKNYKCKYFTMLVYDDFDMGLESQNQIWFNVSQLNVTLKNAEERLRDFRELFHELEMKLLPVVKKYNLDVYFPDKGNPFFGLMIQRLGKDKIDYFECKFPIETLISNKSTLDDKKYYLRVFKEKLCINGTNFATIEESAKPCVLTLFAHFL